MILYPLYTTTAFGFLLLQFITVVIDVVQSQAPPSNDECINATIIPSDTTLLPYVSPQVDFKFAKPNITDAVTCGNASFPDDLTVWYQWMPSTTDIYSFSHDKNLFPIGIELFRGTDCGSIIQIDCDLSVPSYVDHRLTANEMYYIKLSISPGVLEDVSDDSKVRLYVNATQPPPTNAVCANATDIAVGQAITGDIKFTAFDLPTVEVSCSLYKVDNPTLWYRLTNTLSTPIVINASPCNNFTTVDTIITLFEGNNSCTDLDSTCVRSVDDEPFSECFRRAEYVFLAKPFTTYYLAVQTFDEIKAGNVTLTIDPVNSYFALIDANLDQAIDFIGSEISLVYTKITSTKLNIEAVFESTSVKSVMVGYDDDPKYTRCERKPPYSIFKDRDGDFRAATITPDSHKVTATSYSQPDCKGEKGQTLQENFFVEECISNFSPYQVSTGKIITEGDPFPCNDVNVLVELECGFDIEEVKLKFIETTITEDGQQIERVIRTQTERFAPYFLFGNKGDVVNAGTINAGLYSIEFSVNGISFIPGFFNVPNDCIPP